MKFLGIFNFDLNYNRIINSNLFGFSYLIKFTFLIIIFSIFLSSILAGSLEQKILDPYGRIVNEETSVSYTSSTTNPPGDDNGGNTNKFDEFVSLYGGPEDSMNPIPYCRYGGQYHYEVINDPTPGTSKSTFTFKLYYCLTIEDLIMRIKIPKSWQNSNLILYCNDGVNINFNNQNLDFLTTELQKLYKGCIVKNLDLNVNNTIFAGFAMGNSIVDSDLKRVNIEDLNQIFDPNNKYYYKYNLDNFNYIEDNENISYMVTNVNEDLDTKITDVFKLPIKFGISRVALFRNYNDSKQIYGYENAAKNFIDYDDKDDKNMDITSIYVIQFRNIKNVQNMCKYGLAYYNPIVDNNRPDEATKIVCNGNDYIYLNSNAIDSSDYKYQSFTLFKNIILGSNNPLKYNFNSGNNLLNNWPYGNQGDRYYCKPHYESKCLPNGPEEYWYDSCGNREDVKNSCACNGYKSVNCGGFQGNICTNVKNYICPEYFDR